MHESYNLGQYDFKVLRKKSYPKKKRRLENLYLRQNNSRLTQQIASFCFVQKYSDIMSIRVHSSKDEYIIQQCITYISISQYDYST